MKFPLRERKILIVAIVILVILSLNFFQREVKNVFYTVSAPIQKVFWQVGVRISDFFGAIFEIENLKSENEKLKLENQRLLAEITTLKEFKKENEILRTALNLGLEKDFQFVLAEIIGKDIWQDFLLIDKGIKDGISKKMIVITEQKVFVGEIDKVYQDFSRVKLISHPETSLSVKILEKEVLGVVKGQGKGKIFLDFIPQDQQIEKGDLIISLPLDLLVGSILEVKKSDIEPFQKAEILPFFEIGKIQKLFIILNY